MSQKDNVLMYLATGKNITSLQAFQNMGITRISAIIHTLKKEGYNIIRHDIPFVNRHGRTTHIGSWRLNEEEEGGAYQGNHGHTKQQELAL